MNADIKRSFIATLVAIDNKTDNANTEEAVIVEVVDNTEGQIEIAFNDRNERVYLAFRLEDLMRIVLMKGFV